MGTDDWSESFIGPNEGPAHVVFLSAVYIDKLEVTNELYAAFLNDLGQNRDPASTDQSPLFDIGDEEVGIRFSERFEPMTTAHVNLPATYVSWNGANAYCRWIGGRLPTEAEWEKAARGTDGRSYPWGNSVPTSELANESDTGPLRLVDVGSYPRGTSPFGLLDMSGNAMEWVADWSGIGYYRESPRENPPGPDFGSDRVVRSGGYRFFTIEVTNRLATAPESYEIGEGIGFRCARDP